MIGLEGDPNIGVRDMLEFHLASFFLFHLLSIEGVTNTRWMDQYKVVVIESL